MLITLSHEMADYLDQYSNGPMGLVILLPVVAAVVAVILVFVFGFKNPEEPKFKKSSSTSSDGSKKVRRKEKVNFTLCYLQKEYQI